MNEDFYAPISHRLKEMTRDISNSVLSILAITASTPKLKRERGEVDSELKQSMNHLQKALIKWENLGEILDYITSHLDELDEKTLAAIVEKSADSTMALEMVGLHGRLKEVRTAHHMMSLDEDLIPFVIKEVGTHSREKLEKWETEIQGYLKQQK